MNSGKIVEAARKWLGTPYHHQARGPAGEGGGVDCVGLLIAVAKEVGAITDPDYNPLGYAWETDGSQLEEELLKWCENVSRETFRPGDILVTRVVGLPQHTGFVTEIDYGSQKVLGFIHASRPKNQVVEHRLDAHWEKRIVAVYRLRRPG